MLPDFVGSQNQSTHICIRNKQNVLRIINKKKQKLKDTKYLPEIIVMLTNECTSYLTFFI